MDRRGFIFGAGPGAATAAAAAALGGGDDDESRPAAPAADLLPFVDLDRAVRSVLESKRIGRPVFVRLTLLSSAGATKKKQADLFLARLAALAQHAGRWVGQPLDQLHAAGSVKTGQVSLTLTYREGATALVSTAAHGDRDGLDLMLLGSKGAIYHEITASTGQQTFDPGKAAGDKEDPLTQTIQRALRTGKPVSVSEKEGGAAG